MLSFRQMSRSRWRGGRFAKSEASAIRLPVRDTIAAIRTRHRRMAEERMCGMWSALSCGVVWWRFAFATSSCDVYKEAFCHPQLGVQSQYSSRLVNYNTSIDYNMPTSKRPTPVEPPPNARIKCCYFDEHLLQDGGSYFTVCESDDGKFGDNYICQVRYVSLAMMGTSYHQCVQHVGCNT